MPRANFRIQSILYLLLCNRTSSFKADWEISHLQQYSCTRSLTVFLYFDIVVELILVWKWILIVSFSPDSNDIEDVLKNWVVSVLTLIFHINIFDKIHLSYSEFMLSFCWKYLLWGYISPIMKFSDY